MGLDITFYEHARLVKPHHFTDDCYEKGHIRPYYWQQGFAKTQREIQPDRCYKTSGATANWQASYVGFSRFRELLTDYAQSGLTPIEVWRQPDDFAALPFIEMINFADNEGAFGGEVATKLLGDFARLGQRRNFAWRLEASDRDWYQMKYKQFQQGLAVVSSDGLVNYS